MEIEETKNTDQKKANNRSKIILGVVGGLFAGMILCVVGIFIVIGMIDTAFTRASDFVFNPSPERLEAKQERHEEFVEENKATVISNFSTEIPFSESEFIPMQREFLLVVSSMTGNGEFYLVPLDKPEDKPELIQWNISVHKTAEDRHLSVQQIQVSSDHQLIVFEDGSYTADKRKGSKTHIAFSNSDSLKAERLNSGEITISTGTNFEELITQINQINATALTWSNDDKYIYFIDSQSTLEKPKRLNERANQHTVYRVNPDGSELTKIYELPYPHPKRFDTEIVSIPGREELIVNVFEDLIILNPTTGQVSASPTEKLRSHILVSPDGSKIAYKSDGQGVEAMQIQSNGSLAFKKLSQMPGSNRKVIRSDFMWTTDSQYIVYQYNKREEDCYYYARPDEVCFFRIAMTNVETGELIFPLDNYAFKGRILGSVSR